MLYAVSALQSIRKSLNDPYGHLTSWNRGDPCTSNWTGIICYNRTLADGYFHVGELYGFSPIQYLLHTL